MLSRDIGQPSGDMRRDMDTLFDYIAWLKEQIDYKDQLLDKRIKMLEKEDA